MWLLIQPSLSLVSPLHPCWHAVLALDEVSNLALMRLDFNLEALFLARSAETVAEFSLLNYSAG